MVNNFPTDIDSDTVRTMVRAGAQLVDVLSKEQYENVHLAGAVNIPFGTIDRKTVEELNWDEPVIVYCYDYQ
jgi:rhodanese-related sulfurtransferase